MSPTFARTGRLTMHARHRRETLFPSRNVGHARMHPDAILGTGGDQHVGHEHIIGRYVRFSSAPGGFRGMAWNDDDADLFADRLVGYARVAGGVHDLECAPKDCVGRPILSEKSLQPRILIIGNALPLSQSKNPTEPLRLRDRLMPVPDPEGIPCLGIVNSIGRAGIEPALKICNLPALGDGTT